MEEWNVTVYVTRKGITYRQETVILKQAGTSLEDVATAAENAAAAIWNRADAWRVTGLQLTQAAV